MPRTLGFVDGTLVAIVPPPRYMNRPMYQCRKGHTALNVQVICDADLYIMNINAQFPGSCTDKTIWRESPVKQEVITAYRDSGYAHEPWLQLPLPRAPRGTPEYYYTKLHCKARNAVERCIGLLKAVWRCLLRHRTLHYLPAKAGQIINACAALHNFRILRNIAQPRQVKDCGNEVDDFGDDDFVVDVGNDGVPSALQAQEERQHLINYAYARHLRQQGAH